MQTPLDPFPSYVASYFLEGAKPLSYPFHVKCINTRAHFCMLMRLEGDTKAAEKPSYIPFSDPYFSGQAGGAI